MRAIELFAGAGGAALGLEAAGIEHAALCEWDPSACATMRAAGLGPVVEGDVRNLDAIAAVAGESCDVTALATTPQQNMAPDRWIARAILGEATEARVAECERWVLERFYHA